MQYGLDYNNGGGGTPSGGGGFGTSASQSATKARRSYDEQTMVPVTIAQCWSASEDPSNDGNLMLPDGRRLYHVRIVAAVRSFEDFSTNCVYSVEDGTGLLEVKQWSDDQSDCTAVAEMRRKSMKDHAYVKIVGQIKVYDGKKMVVAERVRILQSGNELTHHMLEVIYSAQLHQHKDRIIAPAAVSVPAAQAVPLSNANSNSKDWQAQLLHYIQSCQTEEGVTAADCLTQLQTLNFPPSEANETNVRAALAHWSDEGALYSTVDEHHYKYA